MNNYKEHIHGKIRDSKYDQRNCTANQKCALKYHKTIAHDKIRYHKSHDKIKGKKSKDIAIYLP